MPDFSFQLDPRVIVGTGTVNRVGALCAPFGNRALVVSEQVLYENRVIDRVVSVLKDAGVEALVFDEVPNHATSDVAERAAELLRGARCSAVVGLGGIKTQSIARLAALLGSDEWDLHALLDGAQPKAPAVPCVAVPTTGRDPFLFSDRFVAVDPRDRSVKLVKTLPGLCQAAVIDQELSESMAPGFAATTVFDGFCTAFEAYCSNRANFLSDSLLERAMELYVRMLDSFNDERIIDMAGGSTNAGLLTALGAATSAPGIGTALAFALNGRFAIAKAWASTVLLPYVMESYLPAKPERLARVAALMGEPIEGVNAGAAAAMAIEGIRRRMGVLKVPARLKDYQLSLDRLVPAAESARALDFVAFCPRPYTSEESFDLLKQAF